MVRNIALVLGVAVTAAGCSSIQTQSPSFENVTERAGISTENGSSAGWADYDGNGCVDLLVTQAVGPVLYRNNCDGTFTDATGEAGISAPRGGIGVVWADYDADGDLDWLIVNSKKNSVLLENRAASGNYLKVKLHGSGANRDAVGARLELASSGRTQVKTVLAGKGYASSEELIAHFGLGRNRAVDSLKVSWPGGGYTTRQGIKANQTITINQ